MLSFNGLSALALEDGAFDQVEREELADVPGEAPGYREGIGRDYGIKGRRGRENELKAMFLAPWALGRIPWRGKSAG